MMAGYFPLPAYRDPGPVDFSPINNAIDSNRLLSLRRQQLDQGQQKIDLAKNADARAATTHANSLEDRRYAILGQTATAVLAEKDPLKQAEMWNKVLAADPDSGNLPEAIRNPLTGPRFVQARIGKMMTPEQIQMQLAELQAKRAQAASGFAHAGLYNAQAEALKAKATQPQSIYKSPVEQFETEQKLRKEYGGYTKTFREVTDAYNRVQSAGNAAYGQGGAPSPAAHMALIFNYMKMLDPGSTVREGEYATAENAQGVPSKISNLYNSIINGAKLSPAQVQDFVAQARAQYDTANKQHAQIVDQFSGVAKRYQLDPGSVTMNFGTVFPTAPQPQQGRPQQGYAPPPGMQGGQQQPVRVNTPEEAARLPRGTVFVTPDGRTMRVP